jgi:hypothetical protein
LVVEKNPAMPVMSSIAGFPVVVRVIVPEPAIPDPVMLKFSVINPALASGKQKADAKANAANAVLPHATISASNI